MKRVDVIVPCYQYGRFLPFCIESILGHDGLDLRVLIIDDGSTDDTPQIADQLAAQDSRICVRHHPTRQGHIETYNEGLDWADSDYMLLLSADDMLVPGALNRASRVMDANSAIGLTFGWWIPANSAERPSVSPKISTQCSYSIISGHDFLELSCLLGNNLVCGATAIVRTATQKKIGHFLNNLPHSGDMEMWLRFATYSSVAFINTFQAYYRRHADNMSHKYSIIQDLEQKKEAFDALFKQLDAKISSTAQMRSRAYRQLAFSALMHIKAASMQQNTIALKQLISFIDRTYPQMVPNEIIGAQGTR